jgi:hypothetical protein
VKSVPPLSVNELALSANSLDEVRAQRAELRESMAALEQALAGAAPGRGELWAERVHVAVVELSADLRAHVLLTEAPGGLHDDVLATAPRLAGQVRRLARDHTEMTSLVEELIARAAGPLDGEAVATVRSRAVLLLGRLAHHRQAGADLLYEAYATDVGGGD